MHNIYIYIYIYIIYIYTYIYYMYNIYIIHTYIYYIYVTLCVDGSKAFAGQYILYCPRTRAISRYCPGRCLSTSL